MTAAEGRRNEFREILETMTGVVDDNNAVQKGTPKLELVLFLQDETSNINIKEELGVTVDTRSSEEYSGGE